MKQKIGGKIALLGAIVFIVSILVVAWRCDILLGTTLTGGFIGTIGLIIMSIEKNNNE